MDVVQRAVSSAQRLRVLGRGDEALALLRGEMARSPSTTAELWAPAVAEAVKAASNAEDALALVQQLYGTEATTYPTCVLIASAVVLLKSGRATAARSVLEDWLSSAGDVDGPYTEYEQVVELYAVHTLHALKDYQTAREFLRYNESLSAHAKTTYTEMVDRLEKLPPLQALANAADAATTTAPSTAKQKRASDTVAALTDHATYDLPAVPSSSAAAEPSSAPTVPSQTSTRTSKQRRKHPAAGGSSRDMVAVMRDSASLLAMVLLVLVMYWQRQRLAQTSLYTRVIAPILGVLYNTVQMGTSVR